MASALNSTVSPTTGLVGEVVKSPDGASVSVVDTSCADEPCTPRSLVTVSVTLNVPIDVNVCVAVASGGAAAVAE